MAKKFVSRRDFLFRAGEGIGGIALAYFVYVKHPAKAADMATSMKGLYGLSRNKFYLDELFALLFVARDVGKRANPDITFAAFHILQVLVKNLRISQRSVTFRDPMRH